LNAVVVVSEWFLGPSQRGNPATMVDRRHADGAAWTRGNAVDALVHGSAYFPELLRCVRQMRSGDLLFFTDWRGDPDQLLDGPGTEVSRVLCEAASRGVVVKGLVWRSHLDRFAFSEQQNRHLGEDIEAAGGECLRDMRVRPGGSHHQKFVVLRHPGRPELDVAFVGGIDLCHSRLDGPGHAGDRQRQPMAQVYGTRPPWHDVQLAVRGPAVGDVETVFRERWEDPAPLTRNPFDRLGDLLRGEDRHRGALPPRLPDPQPRGTKQVQVLRTYPKRRRGYPFAPDGERSIARAYDKVIARAHRLIYVEDQYFWASEVVRCFADALRSNPELRLIVVIPHHPDQDGRLSQPPNLVGRQQALDDIRSAGGDRVGVYGIENQVGTPVYVHAKVCIVDDLWASVGSDNVNLRSWTHDSELSCAVIDESLDQREPRILDRFGHGARVFARELRLELAREHLDRDPGEEADLLDPIGAFTAFAESARQLQDWHDDGRQGLRPPGRLRPYDSPRLTHRTLAWATPLYRLADPDGRPRALRRAHRF
jgi:phosphatidylserine/phosphatidylglycerophosphate/cardiolipin synthase-like enzyme